MSGAQRPRSRRWLRLAIPYALVVLALVSSTIAYQSQQPDPTDPDYLSPASDDDLGSNRLAALLAARGVRITRTDQSSEALVAAERVAEGATLFIPAPSLVHPFYLRMIKFLPATTNVVLVAPSDRVLSLGRIPAVVTGNRLSALARGPSCGYAPVAQAGPASVFRLRYSGYRKDDQHCYDGGLAVVEREGIPVTLVGADDPFRNDRIAEHSNAALATSLLAVRSHVVWLDLHGAEQRPKYADDPRLASQAPAPPSLGPGVPDQDFPIPGGSQDDPTVALTEGGQERVSAGHRNPLFEAFPAWVFAAVALIALAALLLALAQGRRMGGPVAEPLPIIVKATETVEGRGRLYQRARAREPAITTLRHRTYERLRRLLRLPPTATTPEIIEAAARACGRPAETVAATLLCDPPADDRALVSQARALEELVRAVAGQGPHPNPAPEGDHR